MQTSDALLLHRLFEREAKAHPDTLAVCDRTSRLTYSELDQRADRVATILRAHGVAQESMVGVHLPRCVDAVVAILATWKAGGGFIPLDPSQPDLRIEHMAHDCGVRVILSRGDVPKLGVGAFGSVQVLQLDHLQVDHRQQGPHDVARPGPSSALPDNVAYAFYTSGSTGQPKGVMVSHRALSHAYRGWEQVYGLRGSVRNHLQIAAPSFDVSIGDTVRALLSGGTLFLCESDDIVRPAALCDLIRDNEIHAMEFTPGVLRLVLHHLEAEGERLPGLKVVAVGGEAWPAQDADRLKRLVGPGTRIFCSYGVTESSVDST
ncbi:MAG: hypothetical protein QOE58_129, partial [Actinomycetota bacterium]|nr:hypothetical protein [Actinomycetota bacterium]